MGLDQQVNSFILNLKRNPKQYLIQVVYKLVIQKSAVITSELELTIWSGTFQKLRLVLKFSFKPPDGIPLVQSCLLNLPVIMKSYSVGRKAHSVVCGVANSIAVAHFSSEKIHGQASPPPKKKLPRRTTALAR